MVKEKLTPPAWAYELSQSEIREIMDTAIGLLKQSPRAKKVLFKWKEHSLKASRTSFRTVVDTTHGTPVCCRYY